MSVADALRMMNAGLDYLNGPGADELDAAACGSVLRSLAAVQAKFTAAHALVLARFDAADAHDCDGYGNSAAWLMAMTDMTRQDARVEMRQMRLLRDHPEMAAALAAKDISKSWVMAIAEWTKKLPAELRAETIKILVEAAAASASRDDLRIIAAAGGSCCTPTAPPRRTGRTGRSCTATHRPPSAPGRARLASWNRPALPAPAAVI
jgi:hypothetical protein